MTRFQSTPLAIALLASLSVSAPVQAELFFNTNAVTYQQGGDFEVGPDQRQIITLEHASAWNWGDLYLFYDRIRRDDGSWEYYSEFSPRLSLGLFGVKPAEHGLVKDILVSTTLERGSKDFEAKLIGPGVELNLPGFAVASANLYYRDTDNLAGETWQITLAWVRPFSLGTTDWVFDGYADIRGDEGPARGDINFNPQLKLDLGKYMGLPRSIYAGIEYYNWHNKFGIKGVHEHLVTPLIQGRFSF